MLHDPVVGGVGALRHHHMRHHWIARWPEPAIGDERHLHPVPRCNAQNLVLDRAGIGIDEDLGAIHAAF
jgi:hypothetical protein